MYKIKNIRYLFVGIIILSFGLLATFSSFSGEKTKNNTQDINNVSQNKVSGAKTENFSQPENITNQTQSEINSPQYKIGEQARVTRVIDGDTIQIESGQKVRYIGIDTPETVDPRKPVQCFGTEAAAKNKELVEGKTITLEKDISETDKYGRLLRYVYQDQVFVNDYLVREGYAHASSYPPDIKYQHQLNQAQQEAQQNNRGLWSICSNNRGSTPNVNVNQSSGDNCVIKGNISSAGEKIYHMLGQKYYNQTVIDQSKAERWFCTEEEAIAAGWRKAKI